MAKIKGAIVVDTERCKGCNLCVVACPLHVIALTKEVNVKGYNYAHQILEDTCNGCASCAQTKPSPTPLSVAVLMDTSVILLLRNRKYWKLLPN